MNHEQFAHLASTIEARHGHTLQVFRDRDTVNVVPAMSDFTAEATTFAADACDLRTIHQAVRAAKTVYGSMTQI